MQHERMWQPRHAPLVGQMSHAQLTQMQDMIFEATLWTLKDLKPVADGCSR